MNNYLFFASLFALLVTFWNRDALPENIAAVPDIFTDPIQKPISTSPIEIEANKVNYKIEPLYEYEIAGLVVSFQHHNGKFGLHNLWNDHLNMADFCLLWGNNINKTDLSKLDFWNGQFTCNVKTSDSQVWTNFSMRDISNNHLLTADNSIRKQLKNVRIGDQIRLRGYLASYSNNQGFNRGTSTTREDTGNGACETIYLESVEVLERYANPWRRGMYSALAIFLLSVLWHFLSPVKAR